MQGKDSKCKCPKLADCPRTIKLVCDKADEETYINQCALKVHSCRKQKQPGVLAENYCCEFFFGVFPITLTIVITFTITITITVASPMIKARQQFFSR